MRTPRLLLVIAALGCAAEVEPIAQGPLTPAPRLYTEDGEPVVGRLKTVEGVTELTVSAFTDDPRVPRDAVATRKTSQRRRPLRDASLGAEVDPALMKPAADASLGLHRF